MPKLKPMVDKGSDGADPGEVETLTGRAYRFIRRDILSGGLEPGSKLKVEALRARYRIGPTPIREALERLASEDLAVAEQQRGFRVAPMSVCDFDEIVDMRLVLESEALRRSLAAGDYAWESVIVSAFHKLDRFECAALLEGTSDLDEWERRNSEFHDALIAAAGSSRLIRSCTCIGEQFARYRRKFSGVFPAEDPDRRKEHRAIMEAVVARDPKRTIRLVQSHITARADAIRKAMTVHFPRRD